MATLLILSHMTMMLCSNILSLLLFTAIFFYNIYDLMALINSLMQI